jgi:predicted nucleic acid-binding protein
VSVVVDASVVVALLVPDARQGAVQAQLGRWLTAGESLHAPAVLPYEVANVLARLVFDEALDPSAIAEIWADLDALALVMHPFDLIEDGPRVAAITTQLRRRHATDSTYVGLAQKVGAQVWTLDGALARNAADVHLPVQLIA